jgi:hypothetical protein
LCTVIEMQGAAAGLVGQSRNLHVGEPELVCGPSQRCLGSTE